MENTTDKRLDPEADVQPTGTTDLRGSALPELDPLAEGNEIQGHAAVPGVDDAPTPVATDWGETLVRQSLSDLENRMTADRHLDHGREYQVEDQGAAEAESLGPEREEASLPLRGR